MHSCEVEENNPTVLKLPHGQILGRLQNYLAKQLRVSSGISYPHDTGNHYLGDFDFHLVSDF